MTAPTLRKYQTASIDNLRAKFRTGLKRLLLVAPTGAGKCWGINTPILMYDGSVKMVQNIETGDVLMGPDSTPRRVKSTTRGRGPMFRITPVKGDPWTCNDVHVLTLVNSTTSEVIDIPLNEYMDQNKTFKHLHKQFSTGVEFPEQRKLPLDPYFLGLWFGDGTKLLSGVAITKPDREVVDACEEIALRFGLATRIEKLKDKCQVIHIIGDRGGKSNPLLNLIRAIVGDERNVPKYYLTASRDERLQFLAGWIDSDGSVSHGGCDFIQKRRDYSEAVVFLARSLGLRAQMAWCEKGCQTGVVGEYWRVSISGDCSIIPTRIERKKFGGRKQKKDPMRTGFSVEPIGTDDYFGFEVTGDGRLLKGDFVVMHNTVVGASMINSAVAKGADIIFLAHRTELVTQCSAKLDDLGVDHGIVMANHPKAQPWSKVQVVSVPTLAQRLKKAGAPGQWIPKATLIFVDEAHMARADSYEEIIAYYPDAIVVGLTATPWRLDGKGMGELFQDVVVAAKPSELVLDGSLTSATGFSYLSPDLSAITAKKGNKQDLSDDDAADVMKNVIITGNIVDEWMKSANHVRTVAFLSSVQQSKLLMEQFIKAGVSAEHIDAKTPDADRDAILKRHREGKTTVLTNVNVLTAGWDSPQTECAILGRPTASVTLAVQMMGRILRPVCRDCGAATPATMAKCQSCGSVNVKRIARIHDHAQVLTMHGLPEEDRDYSLEGDSKAHNAPRQCMKCMRMNKHTDTVCQECGLALVKPTKEKSSDAGGPGKVIQVVEADQISLDELRKLRKMASTATTKEKAAEYKRLLLVAGENGYDHPWVSHQYRATFGIWPSFTVSLLDATRPATKPFMHKEATK